jgi:hypothetical protein
VDEFCGFSCLIDGGVGAPNGTGFGVETVKRCSNLRYFHAYKYRNREKVLIGALTVKITEFFGKLDEF